MSEPLSTFTHNGMTIEIWQDEHASDPRKEFDQLGTLYCEDRRHKVKDKGYDESELEQAKVNGIAIPVCYGHDSIDECDEENAEGYIYATREKLVASYLTKRLTSKVLTLARECMIAELDEYSAWRNGEVYGYVIKDDEGNELDSCWGFYGWEYCEEAAKEACPQMELAGTYAI